MASKTPFHRLTAAEAAALLRTANVAIWDTRDAAAFAHDRIAGAASLGTDNMESVLRSTPRTQPMFIYCYRGNTSQDYARMFVSFGFREVYDLIGGFEAWNAWRAQVETAVPNAYQPGEQLRAWLVEQGFSPDDAQATLANRTTPLMQAARLGASAIAAELIACGAVLDAVNGDGNNALWLACFAGNLELIDLLIAKGVDMNRQNDNGATCLMYAASAGKTEVVARLLAAGADIRRKSLDDFTALDMAANIECLTLLRRAERQVA